MNSKKSTDEISLEPRGGARIVLRYALRLWWSCVYSDCSTPPPPAFQSFENFTCGKVRSSRLFFLRIYSFYAAALETP
ncbi:hypothetical protein Dimus_001973 [Dionaea muscipula]